MGYSFPSNKHVPYRPYIYIKTDKTFYSPRYPSPTGQIPSSNELLFCKSACYGMGINKIIQYIEKSDLDIPKEDFYEMFLIESFCGLYANLTWWANQKDKEGKTLFNKGLIGLDNFALAEKNSDGIRLIEESQAIFWTPCLVGNLLELACKTAIIFPGFEKIAIRLLDYFSNQ
jgi:hypothetical protein